jgi:ATP-binding cassette, subfamily B, bacterial
MDRPLRQSGGLLWRYLKPQWGKVLLLLALLLGSITLQLIAPQFVRTFLDAAQAGGAARELLPLAGFFFVAVLSLYFAPFQLNRETQNSAMPVQAAR